MQYKVPQNIFMEDRIIGPLTLSQFIYLLGGGLGDYISYQFFYNPARGVFFLIAIPVTILALGLAFFKIHEQPLGAFVRHAISFSLLPRERVWHKEESLEGKSVIIGTTKKTVVAPQQAKQLPQTELAKLSEILDTYGRPTNGGLAEQSGGMPTNQPNTKPGP